MSFFGKKNSKLRTLEKLENMKKVFFSRKKRFQLLKLHFYQIGKAQNMPVAASRLINTIIKSPWGGGGPQILFSLVHSSRPHKHKKIQIEVLLPVQFA